MDRLHICIADVLFNALCKKIIPPLRECLLDTLDPENPQSYQKDGWTEVAEPSSARPQINFFPFALILMVRVRIFL